MADPNWLNITEAATYLRVSRQTIYNLMDAGTLPYYTVQGLRGRRIKKEDLDALVRRSGGPGPGASPHSEDKTTD